MCPELCTRVNTPLEVAHIRQLCRVSSQNSVKRRAVMIFQSTINPLKHSVPEVTVRLLTYHVNLCVHLCAMICCGAQRWYVVKLSASVCTRLKACTYSSYQHNKILRCTMTSRTVGITLRCVCGSHFFSLAFQPRVVCAWSYISRLAMLYAFINAKV
jgi:hypothetical protein